MELDAGQSLAFLGPELALAATALVVWLLGRVVGGDPREGELGVLGAAFSVFFAARLSGWGEVWLLDRRLVIDGLALFAKITIALAAVAALWIEADSREAGRSPRSNAPAILIAALGFQLMASAANTWVAYATFELSCLAAASLVGRAYAELRPEAKVRGAFASFAIVGSLAWLSGFAGSADLEWLRGGLFEVAPSRSLAVSAASWILVVAVLARLALVVVNAEPRADGGLIVGIGLTTGAIAMLLRIFFGALSEPGEGGRWLAPAGLDWTPPIAFAAAVAMTTGSVAALRARSLERMLAASSIANAGYALVGASTATVEGLRSALFFVAVSTVATAGAFFVASLVSRSGGRREGLERYRGLLRGRITACGVALAIFLLSLGAMPLLGGFPARVRVLAAALASEERMLPLLAIASLAMLLLAYGRVVRAMLASRHAGRMERLAAADLCVLAVLVASTVGLGLYPEPLLRFASRSAQLLPF